MQNCRRATRLDAGECSIDISLDEFKVQSLNIIFCNIRFLVGKSDELLLLAEPVVPYRMIEMHAIIDFDVPCKGGDYETASIVV